MSAPVIGPRWPGSGALVTDAIAPSLDLDDGIAQRQATFRFELTNGVTGERLGEITPIRDATLSHDTSRTTKRQLDFALGRVDTAAINPLTDRISPFMVLPSAPCPTTTHGDWPLGRYMWADESLIETTAGDLGREQLVDEMFRVDQQILKGISGVGSNVISVVFEALAGLDVETDFEPTPYTSADAWGIGANRGSEVLEALAVAGDYFSPWFGNDAKMHMIRTFDPAEVPASIDLDRGARVIRETVLKTGDSLTAPNTIIVISNNPDDPSGEAVGVATLPPSSPQSVAQRGFAIPATFNLQISNGSQAQAVAEGMMQRLGITEQISLATPPDPRHDSYNVIRWGGVNWLELAWSMTMIEGAPMDHTMRRQHAT
jgi:hypothetical protein